MRVDDRSLLSVTDITVQILHFFCFETGMVEMQEPGVSSKDPDCHHGTRPLRGRLILMSAWCRHKCSKFLPQSQ